MMRMRIKMNPLSPKSSPPAADAAPGGGRGESGNVDCEMRPCGMLVQKRLDSDQNSVPPPTIRLRVKYGSVYHEIYISYQATFGELKKKLQGVTGLHHQDQKLFYKKKERDSSAYLDIVGVKDKSKIVLVEDLISREKRHLEMRKNAGMQKAAKSISEISLEVDRLSSQVSALETVITKGGKVAEKEVLNLTELLMNELIKLDAITVGDEQVKLQRKVQVRRVQKLVETLDMLVVKNSVAMRNSGQVSNENRRKVHSSNGQHTWKVQLSNGYTSNMHSQQSSHVQTPSPIQQEKARDSTGNSPTWRPPRPPQSQEARHSTSATVVTTQWEIFDSGPALIPIASAEPPLIPDLSPTSSSSSASTASANTSSNHKLGWDLL